MDVRTRLLEALHPDTLRLLGFRDDDAARMRRVGSALADDDAALGRVRELVARLARVVGRLPHEPGPAVFDEADQRHPAGRGVLPLLALLATTDDVRALHRSRGIPDADSWSTLADLGQQVRVNRLVHGDFGVHTLPWLLETWSGGLHRIGRLQFNLHRVRAEPLPAGSAAPGPGGVLALSTHIPQTGPLDPAAVDDALRRAPAFFARHFPELSPAWFHCESWLLDPQLAAGLPGSNIAKFQQRWELFGEPQPGTASAVYFTFRRPLGEPVDPDTMPVRSRLEALVADHVRRGAPLHVRHGRLLFADAYAGGGPLG